MSDDKHNFKYRLDLDGFQIDILKKYIQKIDDIFEEDLIIFNEIKEMIVNPKKIKHSSKKYSAAIIATESRTAKAKEKIQNAINILRMEGKKITPYRVSEVGNVSFVTAQKYLNTINEN